MSNASKRAEGAAQELGGKIKESVGKLIDNASADKDITQIAVGYFIGAALMVAGGVVEIFLGVKAEGQSLESIAQPLTADEDEHQGRQPV